MRARRIAPFLVLGGATLLGGWFLQEGAAREENVYTQVRLFQEVVDYVSDQFVDEVGRGDVYQAAIDGLLDELGDPHTSFIPARDYENDRIRIEGDYGGVGLEVLTRDGRVTVMNPLPGTPGARAGIRAGDWFVEISGTPAAEFDVEGAVELLRGKPGTTVDVRMGRPGIEDPIPFTLERAVVQIKAVPFAERLDGSIGYVPLQMFQSTAHDELTAAIDSLRSDGVRGVILDLRGNPGGLLEEGIGVTELFVEDGAEVVETRGRGPGQSAHYKASRPPAFPGLPLVVLVDGGSASASEIVAGALQDHDRAVIIGTPSYGKGSVQTLFSLTGGNVLRLTTAKWFTPVGRSIDRELEGGGPSPDHAIRTLAGYVAVAPEADRPEFRSMNGRRLLGGGGIVPDVVVLPDTLTTVEAAAVRSLNQQGGLFHSALFDFAVGFVQERPQLAEDFVVSPAELETLRRTLDERGIAVSVADFEAAERYVRFQLESEIALQAFGEAGQFRRVARYDTQLARALEVFDGASTTRALLQSAQAVATASTSAVDSTASGAGAGTR